MDQNFDNNDFYDENKIDDIVAYSTEIIFNFKMVLNR